MTKSGGVVNPWITVDSVIALKPCSDYPRERVEALFGGKTRMRLTTALQRADIHCEDRVWLGSVLLPEIRWWCADRAVRVHAPIALDLAGLAEHAERLRSLAPVGDHTAANTARAAADAADAAADAAWATAANAAARAAWATANTAADAAADAAWATAANAAARAAWATANTAANAADAAANTAADAAADAAWATANTAANTARAAARAAEHRLQIDRLIAMARGWL